MTSRAEEIMATQGLLIADEDLASRKRMAELFIDAGYQVTVTSYGYTSNCRYIDGFQRIDIPVVQDWLETFGVTAAS